MTDHPSHPDQLMARALGVCWHSPTADRWACAEPDATPTLAARRGTAETGDDDE